MSMLRIFIIVSVYLVISIEATPCENAPRDQVINICDKGNREEDLNTHNVVIRADSARNCTCELSINGKTIDQSIVVGRHGNYTSSHPGETTNGCGLTIRFSTNNDLFYQNYCTMARIKRNMTVNQKIIIESQTTYGNLQEGSGYCIEIINERLVQNYGALHLECGLQDRMSTMPSQTTTILSLTTLDISSTLPGSSIDTTENSYSNTDWTIDTGASTFSLLSTLSPLTNIKETNSSVTIAVGTSAGCLVLLLLIVITIFAVRKSRRCRSTSKRTTAEGQRVNDMNGSENDDEYGMQYNWLYNMGFQPEPNNRTAAEYKEVTTNKTKKTEKKMSSEINENVRHDAIVLAEDHNGYHTVESAMEIRDTEYNATDNDGTYSTIEEYVNHKESQLDDNDVVRQPSFPEVECKTTHLHNDRADCTEDKSNTDVYDVPDKRKIKHVITPSGCEYAMVNQ